MTHTRGNDTALLWMLFALWCVGGLWIAETVNSATAAGIAGCAALVALREVWRWTGRGDGE